MPMQLAACAEMMFLDLPITERVQRIAEAGFDAEIWDWTRHDVEALAATGAMFSSMTGYIRGDFGDGAGELIRTAQESIAVAETLGCPRLNLHGTGLDGKGLPVGRGADMPGPRWISAARARTRPGQRAERRGGPSCLGNLNTRGAPPGGPFARARTASLTRMDEERLDVLVIGGGITGAGIALDAAARGLSVALAEKDDFAAGTSGRSSRLVHGGLRYLEHGDFGLVRESLRERGILYRLAPHLVRPVAM